jgi:polar amino acid transport system substrate-binding protein
MFRINLKVIVLVTLALTLSVTAFSQKTLKKIAERGELRVGMSANQPPFTMKAKDGSVIGYEADLAGILAESMGVELKIVEIPFPDLLKAMKEDKVDIVMSGMTITMKRNMKVAFAGPYILSGKSILTKSPDFSDTDETDDINDQTIKLVALKGSTSEDFVREDMPDATLLLANSYNEAITMLEEGKANVMVADYPICAYTALVHPEKGLTTIDQPLTIEPIGMAIPPDDAHFHNMITNYLNALSLAGVLDILEVKWFDSGDWVPLVK